MKHWASLAGLVVAMSLSPACDCGGAGGVSPPDGAPGDARRGDGGLGADGAPVDAGGQADVLPGSDAATPPPSGIPPECQDAANRGLVWLVAQQKPDGSWTTQQNPIATTGLAVLKLETHAIDAGKSPFDASYPYSQHIIRGLNYLFLQAKAKPITAQAAGNPDTNANGIGVTVDVGTQSYEASIFLMALVAGKEPTRVVNVPGSEVDGWTYLQVAQEMVDYFAFGQADPGPGVGVGGWLYTALDNAQGGDNSNTQYVTLALEYAEHPFYNFKCTIPEFVKLQLALWVDFIQVHGGEYDGASGYNEPATAANAYKTGALLQQLAFLGQTSAVPKAQSALGYLNRFWPTPYPATCGCAPSWRGNPADYMAMWAIMKGLAALDVSDIYGIDWYADFCQVLIEQQLPDGSWPTMGCDTYVTALGMLSTEWALLVLEKVAPPPPILE